MDRAAARSMAPLRRERRLEASKTDAREWFCCFFDIDTVDVETR